MINDSLSWQFQTTKNMGNGEVDTNEEDQPAPKRRLLSTVVKMEEGEILEDDADASKGDERNKDSNAEVTGLVGNGENQNVRKLSNWARMDGVHRASKMDSEGPPSENVPRVLPKDEDPKLVNRNRRMLGNQMARCVSKGTKTIPVHGVVQDKSGKNAATLIGKWDESMVKTR
ncbi:hypothetical protein Tco_0423965 [Tanacetum coccineum]